LLSLVLAHAVAAVLAPVLVRLMGRRAFLVLACVPLAAFTWLVSKTGVMTDGGTLSTVVTWVPTLDMELAFGMGTLQWVLALLVTGVGALVLAYCTWYFTDDEPGLQTFAGCFLAFAGSMLGLVLAADLLLLYVFWELTTVFSYLLIGHDPSKAGSRCSSESCSSAPRPAPCGSRRSSPGHPRGRPRRWRCCCFWSAR
jgi:multicomponent Na+:H+ antiporter subunit A